MNQEHLTLERAIELARQLDPNERLKLRRAIDQMIAVPPEDDLEMAFKLALLQKGSISEIRRAPAAAGPSVQRSPVSVKGKPVSETIIEDRR
jgi:hypothetical protein